MRNEGRREKGVDGVFGCEDDVGSREDGRSGRRFCGRMGGEIGERDRYESELLYPLGRGNEVSIVRREEGV